MGCGASNNNDGSSSSSHHSSADASMDKSSRRLDENRPEKIFVSEIEEENTEQVQTPYTPLETVLESNEESCISKADRLTMSKKSTDRHQQQNSRRDSHMYDDIIAATAELLGSDDNLFSLEDSHRRDDGKEGTPRTKTSSISSTARGNQNTAKPETAGGSEGEQVEGAEGERSDGSEEEGGVKGGKASASSNSNDKRRRDTAFYDAAKSDVSKRKGSKRKEPIPAIQETNQESPTRQTNDKKGTTSGNNNKAPATTQTKGTTATANKVPGFDLEKFRMINLKDKPLAMSSSSQSTTATKSSMGTAVADDKSYYGHSDFSNLSNNTSTEGFSIVPTPFSAAPTAQQTDNDNSHNTPCFLDLEEENLMSSILEE